MFFHAHPDDESIFTGGTILRLAALGHRVTLVVATSGELGEPHVTGSTEELGALRRDETRRSADLLGVSRVEFLGYRDSGLAGHAGNSAPGCLASADVAEVAERLGAVLVDERADALVVYDETGIYGHPDHIQVHRAGHGAAALAGVATVYEATVDREYLHFVETHLVEQAILAGDLGLARSHIGMPTVMVTSTVDVTGHLDAKRSAMAAHASQIPETTSALQLGLEQFAAVYGWEWFVRHGPPGPIDEL
ncbi:MAG TPA: PIG-L family deacetylase [Acidimicrobiales bacterium]|nr:PIG-L family deacetylase [Acidimicrobiales bacterium]